MAQVATLHIKVEPGLAKGMKALARQRGQTMGELVRQAIACCYQPDLSGLMVSQRQALEAYLGGYVSLGKLAQVMGFTPLAMRSWLAEHSLESRATWHPDDAAHA